MRAVRTFLALVAASLIAGGNAAAEDQPAGHSLKLQLNALGSIAGGCRVTFLAANDMGVDITDAAFEIGFFGKDGVLQRLVSLDFKAMPEAKSKVLQFDVDGLVCDDVGRVLVNDVSTCDGDGLDPSTCLGALETTTLPDVSFGT